MELPGVGVGAVRLGRRCYGGQFLHRTRSGHRTGRGGRQGGFTLVELLVVISIMAVLLSILIPALSGAREQARRALCSSNLHQWGLCVNLYAADNNEKLLDSLDIWAYSGGTPSVGGGFRYPYTCAMKKTYRNNSRFHSMFSLEAIGMYTPGCDVARNVIGGIWQCPSNNISIQQMMDDTKATHDSFLMQYAYFARVESWDLRSVSSGPESLGGRWHGDLLTGNRLRSSRLLMSDTISRWWVNGCWTYNHGQTGAHLYGQNWDPHPESDVPSLTGANQLYGDGHVEWKSTFVPALMEMEDDSQPRVFGGYVSAGGGLVDPCFFSEE